MSELSSLFGIISEGQKQAEAEKAERIRIEEDRKQRLEPQVDVGLNDLSEFFNTDGSPDNTVPNSLVKTDFQEYVYTAGVNDDGVGLPLDEFIQFQIKIIMQGTDATKPVRIKDLRAIALAT